MQLSSICFYLPTTYLATYVPSTYHACALLLGACENCFRRHCLFSQAKMTLLSDSIATRYGGAEFFFSELELHFFLSVHV